MMSDPARRSAYLRQTGRTVLTPKQRRRSYKKWMHLSQEAMVRRDHKVRLRMKQIEERRRRADVLLPAL